MVWLVYAAVNRSLLDGYNKKEDMEIIVDARETHQRDRGWARLLMTCRRVELAQPSAIFCVVKRRDQAVSRIALCRSELSSVDLIDDLIDA